MILPIYLLGNPELRHKTLEVKENSESLQTLIDDMLETMAAANGIGLASPQVGRTERLFVVDISPVIDDQEGGDTLYPDQPMVFINATILDESDDEIDFEEGCLSIPDIHEDVIRSGTIRIQYLDRQFEKKTSEFDGILARVIQHEYDHTEGVLFIDHIRPFRRRLLKRKLREIMDGIVEADYVTYAAGKGLLSS